MCICIVAQLLLLPAGNKAAAGDSLNIIYTGGLNGELEPCGCTPKSNLGGIARLSGFLGEHKNSLAPSVIIDAGNFVSEDSPQGRLKAAAMLESFSIIEYDAVALQGNETSFGKDFLSSLIREYKIPALSYHLQSGASIQVKKGAFDINISVDPEQVQEDRVNILLSDHPVEALMGISGWDLIISSSGELIEEPVQSGKTVIVGGYPKGEKAGIIMLERDDRGRISNIENTFVPLDTGIEEDGRVRAVLSEYDLNVAKMVSDAEVIPGGTTYVGVLKCAECHMLYEESWENTRHAEAFASLVKVGKSSDPECVRCHSVGYGEEGGFLTIEKTPELANVQCEECHGLDRKHLSDYSKPMRAVTEAVCLKCHTKANSPDFNYSDYYEKIKH